MLYSLDDSFMIACMSTSMSMSTRGGKRLTVVFQMCIL